MPRIFTKFSRKAFLLLRSLFDANEDPAHIRKISSFVDPAVLIAKMNFTFKTYSAIYSKIRNQSINQFNHTTLHILIFNYRLSRNIENKHNAFYEYLRLSKDEHAKEMVLFKNDKKTTSKLDDPSDESGIMKT